jgi:hypothetical protein
MQRIFKSNAVELATESLRIFVCHQASGQRLPGTRILGKQLGLSAPTVAAALELLAKEGLVEAGGNRRAYRVGARISNAVAPPASQPPGRTRDLLILTHEPASRLVDSTRRIIESLRARMSDRGWMVREQVVDFLHAKHARPSWSRQINVGDNTRVVAIYGRRTLAEWAVQENVDMLFYGGETGGFPIPMVSVSSARTAALAMSRLASLGHHRIVLPLCDRAENLKANIREVTRTAVEAAGGNYSMRYNNPESEYLTPDVTRRILQTVFKLHQPTALVLHDWKELITAHCHLSEIGLRVPRDISLMALNDSVSAEWFHPKLCRFRLPERRLLREMVKWVENKPARYQGATMTGIYLAGDSIGPPVDGGRDG